jgi:hypothetical protein
LNFANYRVSRILPFMQPIFVPSPIEEIDASGLQQESIGSGRGRISFTDKRDALYIFPRADTEPYASRWIFNELIYGEIAKVCEAPFHPPVLFRAGGQVGLYRLRFGRRLNEIAGCFETHTIQPGATPANYNITQYHNGVMPEFFRRVAHSMKRLLVLDQQVGMRDRTPDNLLCTQLSCGKIEEIRAIDHEHCLALDGDPGHRWHDGLKSEGSRWHPTQMSHFIELSESSTTELLEIARDLKALLPMRVVSDIAVGLRSFIAERVAPQSTSELGVHCERTLDLFGFLSNRLEDRVNDFCACYAPFLKARGLNP